MSTTFRWQQATKFLFYSILLVKRIVNSYIFVVYESQADNLSRLMGGEEVLDMIKKICLQNVDDSLQLYVSNVLERLKSSKGA